MECSSKEMTGVGEIFDKAITIAVGDFYKGVDGKGGSKRGGDADGLNPKRRKIRSCKFL